MPRMFTTDLLKKKLYKYCLIPSLAYKYTCIKVFQYDISIVNILVPVKVKLNEEKIDEQHCKIHLMHIPHEYTCISSTLTPKNTILR